MRPLTRNLRDAGLSIGAAVTSGIALWLARASFDIAGSDMAPIRVAMLPSIAELAGLVVASLLVAAGMAALLRPVNDASVSFWAPVSDTLLPLFALAVLAIPYLPWLADRVTALRLLAGPGRLIVWLVVLGQVAWIALPQVGRRFGLPPVSTGMGAVLFGLAAVCLSAPFVLNARHLIPGAFVDLWLAFAQAPSATPAGVLSGALGLLFDQEYGLIAYAPVLLLAFAGLAMMLREPSHRRLALLLSAASVALVAIHALPDPWWRRSAMPGQQLALLLPVFALPIARLYERLPDAGTARAGARLLLLVSIAITVTLLIFDEQVPARQDADGSASLLLWLSPTWRLWRTIPTFVGVGDAAAYSRLLLWLSATTVAFIVMFRLRAARPGRSALAVTTAMVIAFLGVCTLSAALLPDRGKPFTVEGRVLFPLLETFDPVARPLAIRYDPISRVAPHELPPHFTLTAVPGQRTDPQPVRVVLNARFRLPAGDYTLTVRGAESAGSIPNAALALQVGREGRPLETWPLEVRPGEQVQYHFSLPLDAEFVGFRAPRAVEQTIAELRLTPISTRDVRHRLQAGTVLSAAVFQPATIFFHDGNSYPETGGFWVKGRSVAHLTLRKTRETDASLTLAIHSGASPNVVTVSTPSWNRRLELVPGVTERVVVPSGEGQQLVPLTIACENGFVPGEIAKTRDRRLLGAWVAFIPDDISRTSAGP